MGLDSYVDLRSKRKIENFPEYIKVQEEFCNEDQTYDYELSYFRKCWMIHDIMMELPGSENCGSWNGDYEDLVSYRDGLIEIFSNPEDFNGRSQIFSINEELSSIGQSILNCNWAIDYIKENHDAYIVFIDSY